MVNTLSYPKNAMNFLFTGNNAKVELVDKFLSKLKKGIKKVMNNQEKFKSSNAALYGVGIKVPPFIMNDGINYVVGILNDLPNKPCDCKKCLAKKKKV